MRRLFLIATSVVILLALLAPAALAAGPSGGLVAARDDIDVGNVLVTIKGDVEVPAGDRADAVVVLGGDARISGDVDAVLVAGGTATLDGATVRSLVVLGGDVDLTGGTVISGNVRTLGGTVTQEPGTVVQGSFERLDTDVAALGLALIPLAILFFLGFAVAALFAALVVAGLAARQTRELEALISREPGPVLLTGILGTVLLPALAVLLMVTVVGAPIGLATLFLVLPFLAFLGWIVAAIWVGDWVVGRMRGEREPGRPYLAAFLGVIVLMIAGVLPFVSALATLFGFGALLLAMWRTLRGDRPAVGTAQPIQPAPSAG
jgi:hypothetical protein